MTAPCVLTVVSQLLQRVTSSDPRGPLQTLDGWTGWAITEIYGVSGDTVDGSETRQENHRLDGAKTRRK